MTNRNKVLGTGLENRVVKKAQGVGLSAHKQPGSGVFKDYPSDAVIENAVLVECKVRAVQKPVDGERYARFDFDWVDKVIKEAASAGFDLGVVIIQPKGVRKQYAVMSLDDFYRILAALYPKESQAE